MVISLRPSRRSALGITRWSGTCANAWTLLLVTRPGSEKSSASGRDASRSAKVIVARPLTGVF
jgi:hypothetical protein